MCVEPLTITLSLFRIAFTIIRQYMFDVCFRNSRIKSIKRFSVARYFNRSSYVFAQRWVIKLSTIINQVESLNNVFSICVYLWVDLNRRKGIRLQNVPISLLCHRKHTGPDTWPIFPFIINHHIFIFHGEIQWNQNCTKNKKVSVQMCSNQSSC